MGPGSFVGRYRVVSELGRGGMGVVYAVSGPEGDAPYALKLLLEQRPDVVERFRREAEAMRFLGRHPGIVPLRDVGLHQGHPYLVMDRLPGGSLEGALKAGLPRARALELLVEVARALHFAHEAGFVHRDVKPANVLLDARGRAQVTDFGIARDLQATTEALTRTGAIVGTLAYLAPEQADGRTAAIDRRTDVWALGVLLFEVLTGRRPFDGPTAQHLFGVLTAPAPRPSSLAPDVPPDLEALCLHALEKDPALRPATAEDFARALERALGTRDAGPATQPARRGPVVASAGLALALGLGAGAAFGALAAGPDGAPPPPAGAPPAGPTSPSLAADAAWTAACAALARGEPPAGALLDLAVPAAPPESLAAARLAADLARGRAPSADALAPLERPALRRRLEAEAALRAGRLEDALAALDAGVEAAPWDTGLDAAGAARALARSAPTPAQAARVLARGAVHLAASAPREAGALALEAFDLAPLALGDAPDAERVAALLAAAAREDLLRAGTPAEDLARARRRLVAARLLAPGADLAAAATLLRARAWSEDPARALAARPWRVQIPASYARAVEHCLDADLDPVALRNVSSKDPDTFPTPVRELLAVAHGLGHGRLELVEEAAVARPEVAPFWYGWCRELIRRGRPVEAVLAARGLQGLEDTAESLFFRARAAANAGEYAEALPLLTRAVDEHPGADAANAWHGELLVDTLMRRDAPGDLEAAARTLARGDLKATGRTGQLRALVRERRGEAGDDREGAQLVAEALRHFPSWAGW